MTFNNNVSAVMQTIMLSKADATPTSSTTTKKNNTYVNSAFTHNTPPTKVALNQFKSVSGKIGVVHQGQTGDCFLVASIIALSQSDKGRQFIKNNVKTDGKGNYQVTFRGVKENNTFTVSKAEYESEKNSKLCADNSTVKVIEIAYRKCLEQNGSKHHKKGESMLEGGMPEDFIKDFTGTSPEKITPQYSEALKYDRAATQRVMAIFDDLATKKGNLSVVAYTHSEADPVLFYGAQVHAFCVRSVDKKNEFVDLINPWGEVRSMPYNRFLENFKSISVL